MVKYGKEFRKNQITEWEEKYFDYKAKKKLIKQYLQSKELLTPNDDIEEKIKSWVSDFEENLDKDIKKVYIFFANKEKTLYKKINEYLHLKDEYGNFDLEDFLNQYKQLKELSELSLNMSNFIFYNLKAVIKILKKFDKKIVTSQHKNLLIRINYIQTKIEEQNSDILYLLKFKMIDEVNVILEDLIKNLMKEFKSNKDRLEDETENDKENKLIEEVHSLSEATALIKKDHDQIKKNIQEIDKVSAKVTNLFMPWKDFLRISTDANSKFLQIQKENNLNESYSSINRNPSIIQSIIISKESKFNIFIVLSHGFLYMFSFSVIIPTYTSLFTNKEKQGLAWGFLMMMAPLGTLVNYLYETFLFKRSTKKPIIFSCLGLIIGNLLYIISPITHISLLFVGRFICGLSNLRTHNKMYIINFLLQKDVSFCLTMFHTTSTLGLGIGFLSNSGFLFINSSNEIFNKCMIGPMITMGLSLILLLLTLIKFTEAHSKQFSMTSMQMFGEGIINDDESISGGSANDGEEMARGVRRQTLMLKDIDSKLGNFNRQSNFDDTNLVAKSVNELASKEEGGLHSLLNVFIVYLLVIFSTKFINESIFINSHIFMNQIIKPEFTDNVPYLIPIVLGISCFMILIVELALSRKDVFISEKNLIIILLFLLLINNGLFLLFHYYDINHYFIIATDTILASITEKYTAHLFLYIIPDNYILCKIIHGNVLINIFSMFSRILCSGLLIILNINNIDDFNIIIYIVMTSLSFISLLLYSIFYKEIRVKAINRIIKSFAKDDIKIATEF